MLRFPPKIIFLEVNRVNNIITWRRRWCAGPRLLDRSPSLSVDVGVDRHRRTEEAGRNYSSATLSLPRHRHRQENQVAEEPLSSGKT
jgi:hypothetical protein